MASLITPKERVHLRLCYSKPHDFHRSDCTRCQQSSTVRERHRMASLTTSMGSVQLMRAALQRVL